MIEDGNDFIWTEQEEPHRTRRQQIMSKHPEVTKLCGTEPWTIYITTAVVALQLSIAVLLRNTPLTSPSFLWTAYLIGATANQNLFLAIHEISHNLAFKNITHNRYFAICANVPIGVPYSAAFKVWSSSLSDLVLILSQPYHLDHHKFLGVDGVDTDLPTYYEAVLLQNVFGKAFFCTFQIFFYAVRPMLVKAQPFTLTHLANVSVQILFDIILVHFAGWHSLIYLLLSSFLAGSLHPCAAHFIAEHYSLTDEKKLKTEAVSEIKESETFSYYGPLNVLCYNVGYHNEHHDFPFIPWSRLPKLRAMAPEFYQDEGMKWEWVMWSFITRKNGYGIWGRVKRAQRVSIK